MTDVQVVSPDEAALRRRRYDYEPEQVRLIKATVAEGATDAELGMFLELAARYGLDPFAREIWCVKTERKDGGTGRLLIMVGRDGLRKLARRAHASVDGDIVRENDSFTVDRLKDGTREIEHGYNGSQKGRGQIVGAWCEVRTADSYGYFYAPLEEYLPTSEAKLKYSPWGSQRSVMILAAAERQALRMAIPLSGVVVEGEVELNEERAAGEVSLDVDIGWPSSEARQELEPLFAAINAAAPNSYSPGSIDLLVRGQDAVMVAALARRLEGELATLVASPDGGREEVADAVVVEETPEEPQAAPPGPDSAPVPPEGTTEPPAPPAPPPAGAGGPLEALFAAQEEARAQPAREEEPPESTVPLGVEIGEEEPEPPAEEPAPSEPEPPPTEPEPGPAPEPEPEEPQHPLEPEQPPAAEDPDAPTELPELEPAASSVPEANLEELRADLAYWQDVKADPEYLEGQGMSVDEVDSNIAELRAAIDAYESRA
jgi:hypothetical protein